MRRKRWLGAALGFLLCAAPAFAETADTEPVWRCALGGFVLGSPTAQAGSVTVALDGGSVRTVSASGKELWRFYSGGKLTPYVSRSAEGSCYLSRTDGEFIALNRAGRKLWRVKPGPVVSTPVSGRDGRIFIPTEKAIACYTASGQRLWRLELDGKLTLPLTLDAAGGLIAVLEDRFVSISPFGQQAGYRLSGPAAAVLSLFDNGSERRFLVLYKNGNIGFSDAYNGILNTGVSLPARPVTALSRGGKTAVLLENGEGMLLDTDARVLWRQDTGIAVPGGADAASVLYDERGIYFLSNGRAAGYTGDGRRLWVINLEGGTGLPVFDDDGFLYSGGEDWILYAYRLEARSRTGRRSIYGARAEGSYGTASPPPSPWADYHYRFEDREMTAHLDRFEDEIRGGNLGADELACTAYLMEILNAEKDNQSAGKTHPMVKIAYRVRALDILGMIGSRETIPFLVDCFERESDPAMRAHAAAAIGKTGVDPDGLSLRAFSRVVYKPGEDAQVLTAVAEAIGALCRFSGPPLADTGVRMLTSLFEGDRPRVVRDAANRELERIRRQD